MRAAIRHAYGMKSEDIKFDRSSENKPIFVNPPANDNRYRCFNFNVSHHGDWVVLAAEPSLLCGVDITKVEVTGRDQSIPNFFHNLRNCFTAYEWQVIRNASSESQQLERFFRFWALKEAWIKAIGCGLGFELERIEFHPHSDGLKHTAADGPLELRTQVYIDGKVRRFWTFEEHYIDDLHPIAIALGPIDEAVPSYKPTLHIRANVTDQSLPLVRFRVLTFDKLMEP